MPSWIKPPQLAFLLGLGGVAILIIVYLSYDNTTEGKTPLVKGDYTPDTKSSMDTASTRERKIITPSTITKPPEQTRSGVNAADLYKDAFVLYEALSEDDKKTLRQPIDKLDAKIAEELNGKIQPIVELLRRAVTEANYTDWGTDDFSFTQTHPEIALAVNLGRLVNWEVNYTFAENAKQAVFDLQIQTQLSRSIEDRALIGTLSASALGQLTLKSVQDNLNHITPETIGAAKEILKSMENGPNLEGAMNTEMYATGQLVELLKDPKANNELTKKYKEAMPDFGFEHLVETKNLLDKVETEFPEKALLKPVEFSEWYSSIEEKIKEYPLAELALPNFKAVYEKLMATRVRRSMLNLGLNILESGTSNIASHSDPSSGQPFSYVKKENGFELRSNFIERNKKNQISMEFPASLAPNQKPANAASP